VTARQKELVRETFARVAAHPVVAGLLFYRRLFTLDPSLRRLFHTDVEVQSRKLMEALALIVNCLDAPRSELAGLEALGRRHVEYGVREEHYDTVGAALFWMLEQDLGPAYTPEVRGAWEAAYGFIAQTMKAAARELTAEAARPRGPRRAGVD
jgi:hemoglobin-like flavoprotein